MRKLIFVVFSAILLFVMANPVGAVTNGQLDGTAHPYVGLAVFYSSTDTSAPLWRCSGTLISPTVFVTAGHCTSGATSAAVWFDAGPILLSSGYPFTGYASTGTPYTHPDFCTACGKGNGLVTFDTHDVGVVVLDTPVVMSEYGLLPSAGQVNGLAMGTEITLVGYGVSIELVGHGQPVWTGPRTRMYAPTMLVASNDAIADEFIKLTANPGQSKGGSCFGDSGGPDFLAGTRTFLAVNSFVTNGNCAGVTYSYRVDTADALAFIANPTGS